MTVKHKQVFVFADSGDFSECRAAVVSDLRIMDYDVHTEEECLQQPNPPQMIKQSIDQADHVIGLIGDAYGRQDKLSSCSYTQWAWRCIRGGVLFGTKVPAKDQDQLHLYFASEDFLGQHPVHQSDRDAERQHDLVQEMKDTVVSSVFDGPEDLCRVVMHDLCKTGQRPHKVQNVPYRSLGESFIGREPVMDQLHELFARGGPARPIVLHGPDGVGKTRLAVEYAYQHQAEYTAQLFVRADTPTVFRHSLAGLCHESLLNLPARHARELEVQIQAARRWFRDHSGWLVVIDGADGGEVACAVMDLLSDLRTGHVLITARFECGSPNIDNVELSRLGADKARELILKQTAARRRRRKSDVGDAEELVQALAHGSVLPVTLALEQAAAFITHEQWSIADYVSSLRGNESSHREHCKQQPSLYDAFSVWDTAFARLGETAQALLRIFACFGPEPIPIARLRTKKTSIILRECARTIRQEIPHRVLGGVLARVAHRNAGAENKGSLVDDAIEMLAEFSLLEWQAGHEHFVILPLVREITRDRFPASARMFWPQKALELVKAGIPDKPSDVDMHSWRFWEPSSHLASVVSATEDAGIAPAVDVLEELGMSLLAESEWDEAKRYLERALQIETAGSRQPTVGKVLGNLGRLMRARNRLPEAEQHFRDAIAIDARSDAPELGAYAIWQSELGQLLQLMGRHAEAEGPLRAALVTDETTCEQASTIAKRYSDLGRLLLTLDRVEEARLYIEKAYNLEQRCGPTERSAMADRHEDLGRLFLALNRPDQAKQHFETAFEIDETAYGSGHPAMAGRHSDLGQALLAMGHLEDAKRHMEAALPIDLEVYGSDHAVMAHRHSDLGRALLALGNWRRELGEIASAWANWEQAKEQLTIALDIDRHTYQDADTVIDHGVITDAVTSGALIANAAIANRHTDLAQVCLAMGNLNEAEEHMHQACRIGESSKRRDAGVARWHSVFAQLLASRDPDEANEQMKLALAIYEDFYGRDSAAVAAMLKDFAMVLCDANRLSAAVPRMMEANRIDLLNQTSCLGGHLEVATDRLILAMLFYKERQLDTATLFLRGALDMTDASNEPEQVMLPTNEDSELMLRYAEDLLEREPLGAVLANNGGREISLNHPEHPRLRRYRLLVRALRSNAACLMRALRMRARPQTPMNVQPVGRRLPS